MTHKTLQVWVLALLTTVILLPSCGGSGENGPKEPAEPASTFFERDRFFSSEDTKDKFYLGYHGNESELMESLVYLHVVNPSGDTLFSDNWPAKVLLDARGAALNADSAKNKYILQKMEDIIDDKSLPPAVIIKSPDSDTTLNEKVRKQAEMVFTYKLGQKVKVLSWLEGKANVLEF